MYESYYIILGNPNLLYFRHGLIIASAVNIVKDYATTLGCWRNNFLEAAQDPSFPYDDVFRRKWDMYFAMCQAGFEYGVLQDHQMILKKMDMSPIRLV